MEIEVKDNTKEAIDAKDKAIEAALEIVGGKLERYAKQQCPVDTGLLRNSITYCLDGKSPHKAQQGAKKGGKSKKDKYGDKMPKYDGQMPEEPDGNRAVYVGTNVEYAPIVEMSEKAHHNPPGKAHFLRDSLSQHINEYNKTISDVLKKAR